MTKKVIDQWGRNVAKIIMSRIKNDYGSGWNLLSEDQREAVLMRHVLYNLLGQHEEKFAPAIELCQRLLKQLLPDEN